MDENEKTNMRSATVRYVTVIFVLLRIGKCPAQLRLTKGPNRQMSVVLETKNSNDAEVYSNPHAKGLKWQQKRYVAQAVLVAPLQSGKQIRRNLHCDSEKSMDPSYNWCLVSLRSYLTINFRASFRHVQRAVSLLRNRLTAASICVQKILPSDSANLDSGGAVVFFARETLGVDLSKCARTSQALLVSSINTVKYLKHARCTTLSTTQNDCF